MATTAPPCCFFFQRRISLYSDSPLSSWPQPLGSGGDATPCEDTREDFGLSFNLIPLRTVAGWV